MLFLLIPTSEFDPSDKDESAGFDRHTRRLRWSRVDWGMCLAGWAMAALGVAMALLIQMAK